MRPVAKRLIATVLAAAPGHCPFLFNLRDHRAHAAAFMGTVAIGLAVRPAAGAPGVFAGFDFQNIRAFLGDFGLTHGNPFVIVIDAIILNMIKLIVKSLS